MRVTSKGQITIPQAIREKLGITPFSEVDFVVQGDSVVLVKKERGDTPFKRLRGVTAIVMSTDEIMALTRDNMPRDDGDV